MPDGIQTIEEAFAAAKLEELTPGTGPQDLGVPPAAATDAPQVGSDQPSASDPETQALIDSLVEQPSDEPAGLDDPRFWTQKTEVNGELVTLGELKNGYLRTDDYTRKTQAVAEQRRGLEDAERFLNDFQANPLEFARTLAIEFGWLDPGQNQPQVEVQIPGQLNEEEIDARLQEMLDERVSADPRVLQAQQTEALRLVDEEFDRLGGEMKVSIPKELRDSLIAEAQERQVFDLELLLKARLAGRQRTSDNLIRSGPLRPGSSRGPESQYDQTQTPTTIEEAWAQAKLENPAR